MTEDGVVGPGEVADGDRSAERARPCASGCWASTSATSTTAERRCVPAMRYTPWGDALAAAPGVRRHRDGARGTPAAGPRACRCRCCWAARCATQVAVTEYFSYRLAGRVRARRGARPVEVARYCARMVERFDSVMFEGKVATVGAGRGGGDGARGARRHRRASALRLDANGAWTVPTAREALRRLDPFAVHYWEDPVETYEELAELRAVTRASFSTHLIDLPKAAPRCGAPDAIVTNLNELGGIARTVAFIRACEQLDVGVPLPLRRDRHRAARPTSTSRRPWSTCASRARRIAALVRRRRDRGRPVVAARTARCRCRTGPGPRRDARPRGAAPLPRRASSSRAASPRAAPSRALRRRRSASADPPAAGTPARASGSGSRHTNLEGGTSHEPIRHAGRAGRGRLPRLRPAGRPGAGRTVRARTSPSSRAR